MHRNKGNSSGGRQRPSRSNATMARKAAQAIAATVRADTLTDVSALLPDDPELRTMVIAELAELSIAV